MATIATRLPTRHQKGWQSRADSVLALLGFNPAPKRVAEQG